MQNLNYAFVFTLLGLALFVVAVVWPYHVVMVINCSNFLLEVIYLSANLFSAATTELLGNEG
jgi:hypothetical protein